MKFYHCTNEDNWKKIQEEGVLWGGKTWHETGGKDGYRYTYLSPEYNTAWSMGKGDVMLEVEYDPKYIGTRDEGGEVYDNHVHPDEIPEGNVCWQFSVFKPIGIKNIKRINCVWMKKIYGEVLDYKFEDLKHFSDIIYYDGPILSHFKKGGENFLFLWVDQDSDHNRWLVVKCEDGSLLMYLSGDIGMGELFSNKTENVYITDVNGEGAYDTVWEILDDSEIEEYIPEEGLMFHIVFPKEYEYLKQD